MVDWSRMRSSLGTLLGGSGGSTPHRVPQPATPAPKSGYGAREFDQADSNAANSDSAADDALPPNRWQLRWAAWRAQRQERDVLAKYRADYGEGARIRWWQRLRAGVALFFVITLMGAGLTLLIGIFFIGLTIILETLV